MKVESESEIAQSCLTRSNPMDCSLPGSSIHGIFWATVLEWGAIAFSIVVITEYNFCNMCLKSTNEEQNYFGGEWVRIFLIRI